MNRELLSIIDTILSRGVLICSSLQTPALHISETLTGILLREKEKNYPDEKAQKCYAFTLPQKELTTLYIHCFFVKQTSYARLYNKPTKHIKDTANKQSSKLTMTHLIQFF